MTRLALVLLLTAAACERTPPSPDKAGPEAAPVADRPADVRASFFQDPRIHESSGVAVSRRWPGLIWTHNDSGDGPFVYLTDTLGRGATRLAITGAENIDWEDLALGPCPAVTCLYLADTGNNAGLRSVFRIYRVKEPVSAAVGNTLAGATVLQFSYPDEPEDVEAMFVAPDTSVHLISKRRRGPEHHYRLPASAWGAAAPAVAIDMGPVPLMPDRRGGQSITGAALSPNVRRVAIRTYGTIHFFQLRPDGALEPDAAWAPCDITGVDVQGEGIDWLDATRLVLTSERGGHGVGQISLVTCPHRQAPP